MEHTPRLTSVGLVFRTRLTQPLRSTVRFRAFSFPQTTQAGRLAFDILTVRMNIEFNGKIWYWRGPSPFYFVTVPEEQSRDLKAISALVTYGWGVIPVHVRIGKTDFTTSLFPKDGLYLVPIKASVRQAENLEEGDQVTIQLEVH